MTTPEQGEKRLEHPARFLERDDESAARSLREGMAELFTLQRLSCRPRFTNAWRRAQATILGCKTETEILQEKVA